MEYMKEVPAQNYLFDVEYGEDWGKWWDELLSPDDWIVPDDMVIEEPPDNMHFQGTPGLRNPAWTLESPEFYFHLLFQHQMWERLADQTNKQADIRLEAQRISKKGLTKDSRISHWIPVDVPKMKLFFAHLLLIGVVKKPTLESYWSKNPLTRTPFFGKLLKRMEFQNIYTNLHLTDNSIEDKQAREDDRLYKVRPLLDMVNASFKDAYFPERELSYDEASCKWRGRGLRVFNASKPNKFHIKSFQVCESNSGYCLGIDVYSGDAHDSQWKNFLPEDPKGVIGKVTRQVLAHLDSCELLDKGHHLYTDNYYTSVQLADELIFRCTYICGTVRAGTVGIPIAFKLNNGPSKIKDAYHKDMKVGEYMVRQRRDKGYFAVCWQDKKTVRLYDAIHPFKVRRYETIRKDKKTKENKLIEIDKPECFFHYSRHMGGVDLSGQLIGNNEFLRKTNKWTQRLTFYLFESILVNAYTLSNKYSNKDMKHTAYRINIAQSLVNDYLNHHELPRQIVDREEDDLLFMRPASEARLLPGNHFPEPIINEQAKRKNTPKQCEACKNASSELSRLRNEKLKPKNTSYRCKACKVPLCISPCFALYHEKVSYMEDIINFRLQQTLERQNQ